MGAWIEMLLFEYRKLNFPTSLPLWERGLKSCPKSPLLALVVVAPLVGAWIEINKDLGINRENRSLPLWERGLKSLDRLIVYVLFGRSPCGSVD